MASSTLFRGPRSRCDAAGVCVQRYGAPEIDRILTMKEGKDFEYAGVVAERQRGLIMQIGYGVCCATTATRIISGQ
jgi:hypothetical protein